MSIAVNARHDLTAGVAWKKIIRFFLPIFMGSLLQQLYTTVDAVIVGQFAGKAALAAIESAASMTRIPVNFFVGLSTGATIIISQLFGAKKAEGLSRSVHTSVAFAFAGGISLSVLGVLVAPAALQLLQVPDEIFADARVYTQIFFGGMAVQMVYNIGAGILRAVGNSRTPFFVLLVAGAANVLLDLLFVAVFGWGVAGASVATVISQLASAVLVMAALMRAAPPCRLQPGQVRFHADVLRRIFRLGLPIAVQSSVYPLANTLIQSSINRFGTDTIAAWAVCGKMDLLVWLVADSLGVTISTFVAQNYGAGQLDRARKGVGTGMRIAFAAIAALSAVLFFTCGLLARLFVSDAAVISISVTLMRLFAPLYLFYIPTEILSGTIRGTGRTLGPMLITVVGTCICRVVWILLVVPLNPTLTMVVLSYPVSWLLTSLMYIVYYQLSKSRRFTPAIREPDKKDQTGLA